MDAQQILVDPESAIADKWPSRVSPEAEQVRSLAADIGDLKKNQKTLKSKKKALSRKLADGLTDEKQAEACKKTIQQVSHELKSVDTTLKASLARLREIFATPESARPIPQRFINSPMQGIDSEPAVTVIDASDVHEKIWDAYVEGHPRSTPYHLFTWKSLLTRVHKLRPHYLIALVTGSNTAAGVLPLFEFKSRLFGHFLVSMPYLNYGGPLADNKVAEQSLLDHAASLSRQLGAQHMEIKSMCELNSWPMRSDKASMLLALPSSSQALDKQLGAKLRSQVKQGEKHDLAIAFGGSELLDDYYQVFARNMRDLGTPVYAKNFFGGILKGFPDQSSSARVTIAVVYHRSTPVACGFLCGRNETLEIPWASALRSSNKLNANMFMYRQILDYAIEQGYEWFDFGRSSIDAPTYRFKKQWGAQPVQHYWHYWLADYQPLPQINPENPRYKFAIALWQKLPVWVTKIIGPPIVKNLP